MSTKVQVGKDKPVKLSPKLLATVLMSLRMFQDLRGDMLCDEMVQMYFTDEELSPPTDEEIDELCETLNMGQTEDSEPRAMSRGLEWDAGEAVDDLPWEDEDRPY